MINLPICFDKNCPRTYYHLTWSSIVQSWTDQFHIHLCPHDRERDFILSPIIGIIFISLIERKRFELNKTLIDANRTSAAGC